jgi:hypothetical protein
MKSANSDTHPLSKKRQLLGAMLTERGLMQHKEDVLSRYGVTRIRDLDGRQLDEMIDGLKLVQKADVPPDMRRARSIVLSLLDDMGIKAKNGNWQPVNDYLMQPRIAGKVLPQMTLEELKTCAKRLRAVKKWRAEKAEDMERLAREN